MEKKNTNRRNRCKYSFSQKFPICDGILNSIENNFGPSTRHWIWMIAEEKGAIDELGKSENGRALIRLIGDHFDLKQKMYELLQKMRDER